MTSDIFKEAIANMTQAGGRFGGLMEQQSKTLEGQWSNIGDSIQQMFNEIGKNPRACSLADCQLFLLW